MKHGQNLEGRKFKRFMGCDGGQYDNVCVYFMGVLGVSVKVCVCVLHGGEYGSVCVCVGVCVCA